MRKKGTGINVAKRFVCLYTVCLSVCLFLLAGNDDSKAGQLQVRVHVSQTMRAQVKRSLALLAVSSEGVVSACVFEWKITPPGEILAKRGWYPCTEM